MGFISGLLYGITSVMLFKSLVGGKKNYTWRIVEINGMFYAKKSWSKYIDSRSLELKRLGDSKGFRTFDEAHYAIKHYEQQNS